MLVDQIFGAALILTSVSLGVFAGHALGQWDAARREADADPEALAAFATLTVVALVLGALGWWLS